MVTAAHATAAALNEVLEANPLSPLSSPPALELELARVRVTRFVARAGVDDVRVNSAVFVVVFVVAVDVVRVIDIILDVARALGSVVVSALLCLFTLARAERMSNYPTSTARKYWLCADVATVERARVDARASALRGKQLQLADASANTNVDVESTALTTEEETLILRYHEHKLYDLCIAFTLPRKVKHTAVQLFKRFYTTTHVGEHSLKIIMLTAIYVACKVEESYISAEEFCKGVREDPERVLAAEMTFLATLKFQLVCYSAQRPLDGFLRDIEDGGCKATSKQLVNCREKSIKIIDALMLTDVPLVFPPGQIALCALRRAAREEGADALASYCESVGDRATTTPTRNGGRTLKEILDDIETFVERGTAPDDAVVKDIDKKLKKWRAKFATKQPVADAEAADKKSKRRKSEQARAVADEEAALG